MMVFSAQNRCFST